MPTPWTCCVCGEEATVGIDGKTYCTTHAKELAAERQRNTIATPGSPRAEYEAEKRARECRELHERGVCPRSFHF